MIPSDEYARLDFNDLCNAFAVAFTMLETRALVAEIGEDSTLRFEDESEGPEEDLSRAKEHRDAIVSLMKIGNELDSDPRLRAAMAIGYTRWQLARRENARN